MTTLSDAPQFPALLDLTTEPGQKVKPPYGFRPNSQAQFDYITSPEPNLWFYGNRGGGKSVTARWTCHARALAYPGYRYAILRTSFPELIKNHLIYLGAEMKAIRGDDKGYNASKFICTYPNGSMGFYMQAETDEQTRNALGIELMEVVFDEAPTFKWEHMMMIASSVRVPPDSGLTPLKRFNGNPIGPAIGDIWKYFIDKDVDLEEDPEYRPDEWRSIYIDMMDNPDLDRVAYRKQLGVGLPAHLRAAWLEGRRVEHNQLFEIRPSVTLCAQCKAPLTDIACKQCGDADRETRPYHIITELPKVPDANGNPVCILEQPWVKFYGGYDDGWVDPAVMLWIAVVGSQAIVFNERAWQHTHSPEIAKDILASSVILRADGTPYQLPLSTIYADPTIAKETTSVQSTQDVMQQAWRCMVHGAVVKRCCAKARALTFEPSTNDRELYASAIHRLLQAELGPHVPKIQFLRVDPATAEGRELALRGITGCPYLIKSLPKMTFDENNAKKMAPHKHDHPVVALAYYAMSHPTSTAPRVEVARPEWWSEFFYAGTNTPRKQSTGGHGKHRRSR